MPRHTYTGVTTNIETNNWDDGLHALTMLVKQVPKLTADGCVNKLGAWSEVQLWRVGGQGTTEEFLEDGPFTRIAENGRPADTGNFVVLSYFKVVLENFCSRHHLVYKDVLQSLWADDEIMASVDQGSFESATYRCRLERRHPTMGFH
jgi:hypothetical protein